MGEHGAQGDHRTTNQVHGTVHGNVVQAGNVEGGVHNHTPAVYYHTVVQPGLRRRRGLGLFSLEAALGSYAGLSLGGLICLLNGQLLNHQAGVEWFGSLPAGLGFGAILGLIAAPLTKNRISTDLEYRTLIFVAAGAISFPLLIVPSAVPGGPPGDTAPICAVIGALTGWLIRMSSR